MGILRRGREGGGTFSFYAWYSGPPKFIVSLAGIVKKNMLVWHRFLIIT